MISLFIQFFTKCIVTIVIMSLTQTTQALSLPKEWDIHKAFLENSSDIHKNTVIIQTPTELYGPKGRFEGIDFLKFLAQKNISIENMDLITFIAVDGYKVSIPLSYIKKYSPILAFKQVGARAGKWDTVWFDNAKVQGGPYYLIWTQGEAVPISYWPYAIVKFSLQNYSEIYGKSAPPFSASNKVKAGFEIFQTTCAPCHSVNLQGGDKGPEMNVPKNFTEYLSEDFIKNYVKSPLSYRANSRMLSLAHLSPENMEDLLLYLNEMKKHKVCKSQEDCATKLKEARK